MSLWSFSYLSNSASNTGCAATDPEPTRVVAPAAAGNATPKTAAVATAARIFTLNFILLPFSERWGFVSPGGGDASSFPSLLIVLIGNRTKGVRQALSVAIAQRQEGASSPRNTEVR